MELFVSRTRRGGEGWERKIDQELIRQFAISLFENVVCRIVGLMNTKEFRIKITILILRRGPCPRQLSVMTLCKNIKSKSSVGNLRYKHPLYDHRHYEHRFAMLIMMMKKTTTTTMVYS